MMPKTDSIILHRLHDSFGIAVGYWDRSSQDIEDAFIKNSTLPINIPRQMLFLWFL
ncbi:hypothetical protein ACFP3I_06465 [Chryseobacterium arachidis]|uniref:hypothetical protein n=1 Tax=Chryseobacterium arachidis TaxID=1416778 RepID=UPI00361590EE